MNKPKILVGVYPDLVRAMDDADPIGFVVTYPADEFPFCVSWLRMEHDGTRHDFDDMPCDQWIRSEAEWRSYAENHFGPGNWEIREVD